MLDLEPGQCRSLVLGGLRPRPGPATLTVSVGLVAGDADPVDDREALSLVLGAPGSG